MYKWCLPLQYYEPGLAQGFFLFKKSWSLPLLLIKYLESFVLVTDYTQFNGLSSIVCIQFKKVNMEEQARNHKEHQVVVLCQSYAIKD